MGVEYEVPYYQANPDGLWKYCGNMWVRALITRDRQTQMACGNIVEILWKYVGVGINCPSEKMVEPTRHGGFFGEIMGISWEYMAGQVLKFRVLTNTTGVEPLNQPGVKLCF